MIKVLASKILNLYDDATYTEFPCIDDPRGFAELYGNPDEVYSALFEIDEIPFKSLIIFWDHMTFIVPDYFEVIIEPDISWINIKLIRVEDESLISDINIENNVELIRDHLRTFINEFEKNEEVI